MRRGFLTAGWAVAAAVLTGVTAGCGPAVVSNPPGAAVTASVNPCTATAAYADEVSDAGKVVWQASLPPGQLQDVPSPLVINGVAVFAGITDLTGLRATDGHRLWDIRIRSRQVLPSVFKQLWQWDGNAIALTDYSRTGWRVVAIDPATGKVRWQFKFGTRTDTVTGVSSAVSSDGVLALAAGPYIYAVSLTTGHLLWSRKFAKPDKSGNYAAGLAITSGVVVADYTQLAPPKAGVLAGFREKTGVQLWARTGIPQQPSLRADAGIVYLSGDNDSGGRQLPQPLTALSAASGKTIWHASAGFLYALWTAPGQLIFGSQSGTYDVNPATGARRWRVPGESSAPGSPWDVLLTATDVVYYPTGGVLTDRRLGDGAVAWTQPAASGGSFGTVIVSPDGPNALIAVSNDFDSAPRTRVYTVNLRTGKLAAATAYLPSDLSAAPAVTGSNAIYQLNPEPCASE